MNIEAVAKRAKLSTATVSRTINGSTAVRQATADRVRKAIKELGYIPNYNARALGSGQSGLYGLIISDITNPFFPDLIFSFERIAVEHGIEVLLANTNYDPARMENCLFRFMARKVEGIAVMTSEMSRDLLQRLAQCKLPLVFLNQEIVGETFSNIRVEYTEGFNQAIDHLVGLGHKDIGFIAGPPSLASAKRRHAAVLSCLRQRGLAFVKDWHVGGDHKVEGGYHAMRGILERSKLPTAMIASNDLSAIGAMNAIADRGLRVPEDISIIGFDDILISSMVKPALTTIRLSREEIATRAFFSLFARTSKPGRQPQTASIVPQLVVRQSTGLVSAGRRHDRKSSGAGFERATRPKAAK